MTDDDDPVPPDHHAQTANDRAGADGDPARARVLIGPGELSARLTSPHPPAVLDVRWALGDPNGERDYLAAHIPGAHYVDLDRELSAAAHPMTGRHPLPDLADLERAAREWGLRQGQSVVVYDASAGQAAARAWWLLRWAGVSDVRILDGGLPAWVRAGFGTVSGPPAGSAGDVVLSSGHLPVADADGAARLARTGTLLDARAAARYRGEVEPIDPRAGHIPGAVCAPTADNLDEDGRFRTSSELRRRFDELGAAGEVGVYCGSGVTAAHEIAALAVAGIPATLYAGSWSQWSADPSRPAATGADPG